jgi:hypothetical protein
MWDKWKQASPTWRILSGIAAVVILGLIAWLLWAVVYRLFFQGQDLAKEKGNAIVAQEQGKAESNIAVKTLDSVKERDAGREEIRIIVQEGRSRVDEAYKGETVGVDVDRAGADALCRVHNGLCRHPGPATVQPVR